MEDNQIDPQADDSWIPGLAAFLKEQAGVEAVLLDAKHKKISVATLGPIDQKQLEKALQQTLQSIEETIHSGALQAWPEGAQRFTVKHQEGQTLLEKPSCYTAPSLYQWREISWPTLRHKESCAHDEDWRVLAFLAGACGVAGLTGFILKTFAIGPEWLSVSFFMAALTFGGWDAAKDVVHKLPKGKFDIHFLMLAVAIGASVIGAWEEGALLLFLFSFSEALEHFALHRTRKSIDSLFKVAPKNATLLQNGEEVIVSIETVKRGDTLVIKPGDLFPVDAEVLSGKTAADESNLTGESTPVNKSKGDLLYSGTLNLWGAIEVKVLHPASESSLQKIIRLIQEAQHLKAPSQRFTDRFGTSYTFLILGVTTLMFFVWWLGLGLNPFLNTEKEVSAFYRAMTLLVVASPCALALSIPSAILAAIAWGAQRGVLFRGGAAIEKLSEVDVVALDKTGTLTTGDLEVERVESFPPGNEEAVTRLAYSLERKANHPLARAIVLYAKKQGLQPESVEHFQSLTGQGVQGKMGEALCVLGRRELLEIGPLAEWIQKVPELDEEYSEVWVVYEGLLGRILLKDKIREQSRPVLDALDKLGVHTVMLTGDRRHAAQSVGEALGIKEVCFGLKPEDKVAVIKAYTEQGKKVAMVGDGVNDAPSLAAAFVSVVMGARGSDAALEQSELVLMEDRIENFLSAFYLSKRACRIIRQNLVISLGTIIIMVGSSIAGWVPLSLGVFAHEGSTALVCLNSLRLLLKGSSENKS